MSRPWRVLVVGTNFGRVHARGVRSAPVEFELAGLASRGGARSRREAEEFGVPHLTFPEDPAALGEIDGIDGIDAACVAVGSAVSGGRGAELACALLERGIAVLAEHPMHPDELATCLRTARRNGVAFRLTTHYPHVAPVRTFLAAAGRLRARQPPLFVDAATPVHVLQPFLDVVARALGGVRPWSFGTPDPFPAEAVARAGREGPLRSVQGVVAGVPVTLRVHNQLHPGDRDNHALLWHRIAIGCEGGVLTLADTHGPVLWTPRLHASRDTDHRLDLDPGGPDRLSTTELAPAGTQAGIVTGLWPEAVAHALRGLRAAAEAGTDPLRDGGLDLAVARMWVDLVGRLGPPESIRPRPPEVLDAADLMPPSAGRTGVTGPGGPAASADRADLPAPAQPAGYRADPSAPTQPAVDRAAPSVPVRPAALRPTPQAAPPDGPGIGYGATAEFFDPSASRHTAATAPALRDALAGVDPDAGPVADIGAGTGLTTAVIAAALPGVRILAAEPSPVLRAVLTSRVVRDPDLRRRVTVVPGAAPGLELPDRLAGAVLCGVVGHLDEPARLRLWRRLAERLVPGAPLVVELMALDAPVELPPTRLAAPELGGRRHEWWFAAQPCPEAGPDALELRSTWRVAAQARPGGAPAREVTETYRWYAFGLDRVAAETGWELRVLRGDSAPLGVLTRKQ
ncbi:Gfo/Idh/MocA family oxidoreductase [Pseudonocardia sp. NPDC049635]|uniref:Gfo/Idh/MocA family oxidoreductase n=1 Tax=Pseudonocardia sp. NPDC049635 TaxID=3155506 RepID=UPI0033FCBDDF